MNRTHRHQGGTERPRAHARLRVAAPLVLGVLVLVAWHLATTSGAVPPTFLPTPLAVWDRLVLEVTQGGLLRATFITLGEAVLGCVLAAAIALPTGWLVARSRVVAAALQPYLAASQAIPAVAIAPLLVLWVGYGIEPVVLLCALLVFFPIVLSTVLGLRTLDTDVIEAARLDGAHGWRMIRHIELPLATPALLTGLRNGFTLSITGAVVGELVMGGRGLGLVLGVYSSSADTTGLVATLAVLCVLAVLIFTTLLGLERLVDPLRPLSARRTADLLDRVGGPVHAPAPAPGTPTGTTAARP